MIKSISFYINKRELNNFKYQYFYKRAIEIRDFKNHISKIVFNDFEKYVNKTEYEWRALFSSKQEYCNINDDQRAISDVYFAYKRRYEKFQKRATTKLQDIIDFENVYIKKKSTKFTEIVTYFVRYWNDTLINHLNKKSILFSNQQKFQKRALFYYEKYGERLIKLVNERKLRILKETMTKQLDFDSLNFRSINELSIPMIQRNKNKNSKYGAIIVFGGQRVPKRGNVSGSKGKIIIPVKYNEKYHGDLTLFDKVDSRNRHRLEHLVCFEDKRLKLVFWKEDDDKIKPTHSSKYLGVDINIKNNLFTTSTNQKFLYDKNTLIPYFNFIHSLDKKYTHKKKNNIDLSWSIKDKRNHKNWSKRITDMLERKCSELMRYCLVNDFNHLVFENLDMAKKIKTRSATYNNFTYSRLIYIMHLVGARKIIERLALKFNIQVTFIQPQFTSICCNKCYHIEKKNRRQQEKFVCKSCDYKENADFNAALNIRDRMVVDVLRENLLLNLEDEFVVNNLNNEQIYQVLREYSVELNKIKTIHKS
jgi:transposase